MGSPKVLVIDDDTIITKKLVEELQRAERKLDVMVLPGDEFHVHPLEMLSLRDPADLRLVMVGEDDGPRATWKPKVGTVFCGHGPGKKFTPDGKGGGTLEFTVLENRKGFRPGPRRKVKRVLAFRGA